MKGQKKLFENLRLSSAYNNGGAAKETKKRAIVKMLVKKQAELEKLCKSYQGENPIGFIIESAARLSPSIPKNTPEAEKIERVILKELHLAGEKNADCIWIKIRGAYATIWGVSEIKASYEAFSGKRIQIKKTIEKIPDIVYRINTQPNAFQIPYTLKIKDPLITSLIVPFDEKKWFTIKSSEAQLLDDYHIQKIVEIEFTNRELIFIAKKLFRDYDPLPHIRFYESDQGVYEEIMNRVITKAAAAVTLFYTQAGILSPTHKKYAKEIGLFVLLYGRIPLSKNEVRAVRKIMKPLSKDELLYPRTDERFIAATLENNTHLQNVVSFFYETMQRDNLNNKQENGVKKMLERFCAGLFSAIEHSRRKGKSEVNIRMTPMNIVTFGAYIS
ncbi:MAG: hypothetical protein HY445_02865 [Candidatus Niyogibacteria bacterium]|nr:hypothetical protein [Candidatus Niyogibacteria bacterium]